ncbi:MAG: signal recognition particle protein [Rickettsiaceae bacterium]|nr:MAG: signal recognition particle protein [Rickettsiaceae bacterium]
MFKTLTQSLSKIFDRLTNSGTLSEVQINEALQDIRTALLAADVALSVVKDFISAIRVKALGQEIIKSISPGQMIVKIIHDEIIHILSAPEQEIKLNLNSQPPVNILMVGLQGSGKTTASAKLAYKLKKQGKKVLLVSLDTYRPAAQEQLQILSTSIEVSCLSIIRDQQVLEITNRAIREAKLSAYDVAIYDTAGRLHLDAEMMSEVCSIKSIINPTETILVVDSMTGQDAVAIATNFNDKLNISGILLSRMDGDSRGGAALSMRHVTGKPIKFLSSGEKMQDLEEFDAKRLASRILDMGDIISLVEKAESVIDKQEADKLLLKLQKGKFDFTDYLSQIRSLKKLGGVSSMLSMLPGISKIADKIDQSKINDKLLCHQEAIILSMSKKERKNPDLLNASRRKRIADGSGTSVQQVNILIKQHRQTADLMKKAGNPKSRNWLSNFKMPTRPN